MLAFEFVHTRSYQQLFLLPVQFWIDGHSSFATAVTNLQDTGDITIIVNIDIQCFVDLDASDVMRECHRSVVYQSIQLGRDLSNPIGEIVFSIWRFDIRNRVDPLLIDLSEERKRRISMVSFVLPQWLDLCWKKVVFVERCSSPAIVRYRNHPSSLLPSLGFFFLLLHRRNKTVCFVLVIGHDGDIRNDDRRNEGHAGGNASRRGRVLRRGTPILSRHGIPRMPCTALDWRTCEKLGSSAWISKV